MTYATSTLTLGRYVPGTTGISWAPVGNGVERRWRLMQIGAGRRSPAPSPSHKAKPRKETAEWHRRTEAREASPAWVPLLQSIHHYKENR